MRRNRNPNREVWESSCVHAEEDVNAALLLIFSGLGHLEHIGGPRLPLISHLEFHWGLATLALLFPGREILLDGWRSLRYGTPNMNSLVGLGTRQCLSHQLSCLYPA